ncbi:MAG: hypothetical protein RLZZ631_1126 [Cyanobacteriota bacterium]|jgi:hypothetical protein
MAESSRRFSLVDAGAAAAVLLAAAGVIWSPKLSGAVARATGSLVPVTVMVDVRGVPVANPDSVITAARDSGKVAIVIRNQPHGSVAVQQVIPLQRRLSAVLPDGKVVSAPDPNQEIFPSLDVRFVLKGEGRKGADGVVFGNQNLKIGAPVELEGSNFRVTGSVTGLQLGRS